MPKVNYQDEMEKKEIDATLEQFANRIAERWPGVASCLHGARIAVKLDRVIDLAQLMQAWTRDLGEAQKREIVRSDIDAISALTLKAQIIE